MAKEKISQWDVNPANNTDVGGINIAENCPPKNINNAIREVMSQVKEFQIGAKGDSLTLDSGITSNGTLTSNGITRINGSLYLDGSLGTNGQVLKSVGSANTPVWSSLGTMSTQNRSTVNITGGTIGGSTKTGKSNSILMSQIGTNATGNKTVSSLSPTGGADGDVWYKI